jgi:hypothetical protein
MTSITSANATIIINVAQIFPNGFNLTRFATDDIYSASNIRKNIQKMGVDGYQSSGKIWVSKPVVYHFQADSPSCSFFDQWAAAEDQLNDTLTASGLITLTGLGTKFNLVNGSLGEVSPIAQAGQTLKERSFEIVWNQITPAPYIGIN